MGLQEVEYRVIEEFGKTVNPFPGVPLNTLFVPTRRDAKRLFGNALLTTYPVLKHLDVALDTAKLSPHAEKRRAIFALLSVDSRRLWVVVSHIDPQKRYRRLQGGVLFDEMQKLIDFDGEDCIVLMDFNEWYRPSPLLRRMDAAFPHAISRPTFPTLFPLLQLDRIWATRGLTVDRVWVHKKKTAKTASDHYPLCAEMRMKTPMRMRPDSVR
jgi:endonuclease/exonuclease/phosphatase family metal-dependent hydrolase